MKNLLETNTKQQRKENFVNFKSAHNRVFCKQSIMDKVENISLSKPQKLMVACMFLLAMAVSPKVIAQSIEKTVSGVQETYTVRGTVFDDQNLPLPGANIVLKNSKEGVIANEDGKFEFLKPLKVNDVLVFSYLGFKAKEYVVTANKAKIIEVNIQFSASDITLIGEVSTDRVYSSKQKKHRN